MDSKPGFEMDRQHAGGEYHSLGQHVFSLARDWGLLRLATDLPLRFLAT